MRREKNGASLILEVSSPWEGAKERVALDGNAVDVLGMRIVTSKNQSCTYLCRSRRRALSPYVCRAVPPLTLP